MSSVCLHTLWIWTSLPGFWIRVQATITSLVQLEQSLPASHVAGHAFFLDA